MKSFRKSAFALLALSIILGLAAFLWAWYGRSPQPRAGIIQGSAGNSGLYAIVIGIDQWYSDSGFPALLGACNDARGVAAKLRSVGYTVILMTSDSLQPDHKPTHENILEQLKSLAPVTKGAQLVVFISGHGVAVRGTPYLAPMDASLHRGIFGLRVKNGLTLPALLKSTTESGSHFTSFLLVTDVCKAGADRISGSFVQALAKAAGQWAVLSACSAGEAAFEIPPAPIDSLGVTNDMIPEDAQYRGRFSYGLSASAYIQSRDGTRICRADSNEDGIISWREASIYGATIMNAAVARSRDPVEGQSEWRPQTPKLLEPTGSRALDSPFARPQSLPGPDGGDRIEPHQIIQIVKPGVSLPLETEPVSSTNQVERPLRRVAKDGRFFVYTNFDRTVSIPFQFYGYMAGGAEPCDLNRDFGFLDQMIKLDLKCADRPFGGRGTCISMTVLWSGSTPDGLSWNEGWAGVCAISGKAFPMWWAELGDNRGRYYDLRQFKVLKGWGRSTRPETPIEVRVGPLSCDCRGEPLVLGDSLAVPIMKWVVLGTNWTEFSVPLVPRKLMANHVCEVKPGGLWVCRYCGNNSINPKSNDLSRICSVSIALIRSEQPDDRIPSQIFLDDLYFE